MESKISQKGLDYGILNNKKARLMRTYPSKLLLFGEYTVLSGSQALAVPLSQWKGHWVQEKNTESPTHLSLKQYMEWLGKMDLISPSKATHIFQDMEEGWTFHSDVPMGYGLGSSGVLVAAVYDRYIRDDNINSNAAILEILSKMESWFHGTSSGMDPLVSLSQSAVYKNEKGDFQTLADPGWPEGFQVFLLDSGTARTTAPLVNSYKEILLDETFRSGVECDLIPMVEHAIHFYLSGSAQMLEQCLSVICQFQRKYFSMFIPEPILHYWDQLMEQPGVYIKLCGAGGGGYFLVISTAQEAIMQELPMIRIY